MNSLDLSNVLGGTGGTDASEFDSLFILALAVTAVALVGLGAIAVMNWRAARTLKEARHHWAQNMPGPGRRLMGEAIVKPNPMRK